MSWIRVVAAAAILTGARACEPGPPPGRWEIGGVYAVSLAGHGGPFVAMKVVSLDRAAGCALLYDRSHATRRFDAAERGQQSGVVPATQLRQASSMADLSPTLLATEAVTEAEAALCSAGMTDKAWRLRSGLLEGCSGRDEATGIEFRSGRPAALPDDFELRLSRTSCFGTCPAYSIVIDARGRVSWLGDAFVDVEGEASDTLEAESVMDLAAAACHAKLFERPDAYDTCPTWATDNPSVAVAIRANGRHKRVVHDLGCQGVPATDELDALGDLIDEIVRSERWVAAGTRQR